MYAAQLLMPLYSQGVRGQNVLHGRPAAHPRRNRLVSPLSRIVAGKLTERFGARTVTLWGAILTAITTLAFCFVTTGADDWLLAGVLFICDAALGIPLIPVLTDAYVCIGALEVPHDTIIPRMGQQVGTAVDTAVAAITIESAAAVSLPAKSPRIKRPGSMRP